MSGGEAERPRKFTSVIGREVSFFCFLRLGLMASQDSFLAALSAFAFWLSVACFFRFLAF